MILSIAGMLRSLQVLQARQALPFPSLGSFEAEKTISISVERFQIFDDKVETCQSSFRNDIASKHLRAKSMKRCLVVVVVVDAVV